MRASSLRVAAATDGSVYEVSVDASSGTALSIMEALLRSTGLALKDQILLCGPPFKQLGSKRSIRELLAERESNPEFEVFVFNKRSLFKSAAPPTTATGGTVAPLEPVDVDVPSSPTGHEPSAVAAQLAQLEAASSPLGRALIDYERQFRLHRAQAQALQRGADARLASCRRCVKEQLTQIRAMGAATSNLQHHLAATSKSCEKFAAAFATQRTSQQRILQSFDGNLELLRSIDVHPAIWEAHVAAASAAGGGSGGGSAALSTSAAAAAAGTAAGAAASDRSLLAALPIERLRSWHAECTRSHEQLCAKVTSLLDSFAALVADAAVQQGGNEEAERGVRLYEAALDAHATGVVGDSGGGEAGVAAAAAAAAAATAAVAAADADASTAGEESSSSPNSPRRLRTIAAAARGAALAHATVARDMASMIAAVQLVCESPENLVSRALQACSSLEVQHKAQREVHLPQLRAFDDQLRAFQQTCAESKAAITSSSHRALRSISSLQSKIRDVGLRMSALREAAAAQRSAFEELEHVEHMPSAYVASVGEMVCRRRYGRLFAARLESMADTLAAMHDDEIARRERFIGEHGQHLPAHFLPGLCDRPAYCEIRSHPSQHAVPQIERVELPAAIAAQAVAMDGILPAGLMKLADPAPLSTISPDMEGDGEGSGGGGEGSASASASVLVLCASDTRGGGVLNSEEETQAHNRALRIGRLELEMRTAKLLGHLAAVRTMLVLKSLPSPSDDRAVAAAAPRGGGEDPRVVELASALAREKARADELERVLARRVSEEVDGRGGSSAREAEPEESDVAKELEVEAAVIVVEVESGEKAEQPPPPVATSETAVERCAAALGEHPAGAACAVSIGALVDELQLEASGEGGDGDGGARLKECVERVLAFGSAAAESRRKSEVGFSISFTRCVAVAASVFRYML